MKTIQATFENGVFRPKEPVNLPQGQEVEISVPDEEETVTSQAREGRPQSFGCMPKKDAEEMERAIEEEFERIEPDEWK